MRKSTTSKHFFRSFEAKSLKSRSPLTRFSESLTNFCGKPSFLVLNALFFVVWIAINTNLVPGIASFDPYPFGFLTMSVSLEAIFLSIFVLISQNRGSRTSTIRDEVNLQVNMITEQEVTKILQILSEMRKQMGIVEKDVELEQMILSTNENRIEREIEKQIADAQRSIIQEIRNVVKPS